MQKGTEIIKEGIPAKYPTVGGTSESGRDAVMRFLRKLFRNRQGEFVSTRSAKISCAMGKKSVSFCCSKRAFLLYLINNARPPNMLSCRGKQVFLPPFSPSLPVACFHRLHIGMETREMGLLCIPSFPRMMACRLQTRKRSGRKKEKGGNAAIMGERYCLHYSA